jgi:hypothetical protein
LKLRARAALATSTHGARAAIEVASAVKVDAGFELFDADSDLEERAAYGLKARCAPD